MSNLRALEKKWIENFSKSPLVDRAQEAVNPQFAFEFFDGKSAECTCPDNFLFDFNSYYNNHTSLDIPAVLQVSLKKNWKKGHRSEPMHLQTYFLKQMQKKYGKRLSVR